MGNRIDTDTIDELVICTTRYYLGRMSYAALTFPEKLPGLMKMCSKEGREIIIRDIREYIERIDTGKEKEVFDGDVVYWKDFLKKYLDKKGGEHEDE